MNTTACINLLLGKKKNKVLVGDKAVQDILRRRIAGYDLDDTEPLCDLFGSGSSWTLHSLLLGLFNASF